MYIVTGIIKYNRIFNKRHRRYIASVADTALNSNLT